MYIEVWTGTILICSCSTSPDLSSSTDPVLSLSLSSPEIVTRGIDAARLLASGGLSSPSCPPGESRRVASPAVVETSETPDGAEYLSLLVACALPGDASLVAGGRLRGRRFEVVRVRGAGAGRRSECQRPGGGRALGRTHSTRDSLPAG